jgi:dihydrofolate synthase/folylpolyglutamate synthase
MTNTISSYSSNISKEVQEKLEWMYELGKFGIKLGLDNINLLCNILDNPQDKFESIHIAGTNGKGSTAAMLYSILKESGKKTALYTSPHLTKFNERIVINNVEISDQELSKYIDLIKTKVDNYNINLRNKKESLEVTFFEFTTALAFLYFADNNIDIAVIETGLGGRLDATNVLSPKLSIITSISKDHTDYLGDTEKKILYEKLGIAKKDSTLITGVSQLELVDEIKLVSKDRNIDLQILGEQFNYDDLIENKTLEQFNYSSENKISDIKLFLIGKHQVENACLAIRAIELSYPDISYEIIKSGLEKTKWKARFEIISEEPLIIVDSAHNMDGFTRSLETLKRFDDKKIIALIGFSKDKEIGNMLSKLRKITTEIIITQSDFKPLHVNDLERHARDRDFHILYKSENPQNALDFAKSKLNKENCLYITGSIYMIGKIYSSLSFLSQDTPK